MGKRETWIEIYQSEYKNFKSSNIELDDAFDDEISDYIIDM